MSMGSPHEWHQVAAEELVAELGCNPGRVVDVGARILANKMSVEAYAETLTDDPERLVDPHGLPSQIALVELLNPDAIGTPEKILERWHANGSTRTSGDPKSDTPRTKGLRTVVGQSEFGPLSLDLRSDGLNALVGATTGGGKSEFLQTWVLGLALEYGPDRVTFLFVDYKGGSAFADCVRLPHCVGLITDLSHRLAQRALISLRAEVHWREHLLNKKKARDLLELEKRGDPEAPPSLVIMVDEFAPLVGDLPEFVDGLVDVAQRGRPLGIHLIMGTQRPTGVVSKSLSAIAGLRVALRTADGADSRVFLGSELAAEIDPRKTGRAYVKKSTSGEIVAFQAAYSSGWSIAPPTGDDVDDDDVSLGPNDQQQLVARIQEAFTAGGLPLPRRPWLDSLDDGYDLTRLYQRTDSELLIGVADIPEQQVQRPIYFYPDQDGHLGIYGTSGSGKSTALRTLATAAGITPRSGPVHVYGLDFAAGALRMLESLPHVGTIAQGKDHERVVGLLRMLRDKLLERREAFEAANASSLTEYRSLTDHTDMPRIVVVLDGFPKFREEYDTSLGRMEWFTALHDIFDSGRGVGMHVIFTADRYGAAPSYVRSVLQRNILLRMPADGFLMFDAPRDIVTQASPSGRAVVDALEVQVAVVGGTSSVQEQAKATERLAEAMRRAGVGPAPTVQVLPREYPAARLPDFVGAERRPVLGLDDIRIAPVGFEPTGTLVVAGPPGSGRSNACVAICRAVQRADPEARLYLFAQARSAIAGELPWADTATDANSAAALAEDLLHAVQDEDTSRRIVVVVEGYDEYLNTPADQPIQDLTKAIRKSDHLLVAEAETSAWSSSWRLLSEAKEGRRGLILQPERMDGDIILNTALPRAARSEFPPGRGVWVARGKSVRVQLPLVLGAGTG
jgi:S-DNA-T family DNA segregation ATPase FtsK/SpoIIIE